MGETRSSLFLPRERERGRGGKIFHPRLVGTGQPRKEERREGGFNLLYTNLAFCLSSSPPTIERELPWDSRGGGKDPLLDPRNLKLIPIGLQEESKVKPEKFFKKNS